MPVIVDVASADAFLSGVIVMPVSTVAALQIGSLPGGKAETLAQILAYEDEILGSGARWW
jgi:nitrilase